METNKVKEVIDNMMNDELLDKSQRLELLNEWKVSFNNKLLDTTLNQFQINEINDNINYLVDKIISLIN